MVYLTIQQLQRIENQLHTYQLIFWLCVAGTAVFAGITVFLFFYFRIPKVFMELTGLDRKRKMVAIQKRANKTGGIKAVPKTAVRYMEESDKTAILPDYMQMDGEETVVLQQQEVFVLEKELKLADSEKCL